MNAPAAADLATALTELEPLLSQDSRAFARRLNFRLVSRQFRVLVVGEAKRGKSTFVNALIGRDVLPTGVLPLTALITTLVGGFPEHVLVDYADGRREEHPLAALADFVTETGNPHNRRGVDDVTVVVNATLLSDGLQLVDTPSTGSIFEHNTREAEHGLDDVDAAIFVFTADPPISAAELRLLDMVRERAQFVLFVLNKTDYLSPDDVRRVHEFTADAITAGRHENVEIHDCSAARALAARQSGDQQAFRDSGIAGFEEVFRNRLATARDTVLLVSVAAHAKRLLEAELDNTQIALRVLQLRATDEQHRIDEFANALKVATGRQEELRMLVDTRRRLLAERLADDSEKLRRRLTKEVLAALDELVDSEQATARRPRELEEAGHTRAAAMTRVAVEAWRGERQSAIQTALSELTQTVSADVNRALDSIRHAGRDVLKVDLALGQHAPGVPASTRFNFDFSEDAGPTELLAGAIRRKLPGRFGRRRAVSWLRRDARDLIERHVGRARSDMDDRLRVACRQLTEQASGEITSIAHALQRVIDNAVSLTAATEKVSAEQARLEDVISELRRLNMKFSIDQRLATTTPEPGRMR